MLPNRHNVSHLIALFIDTFFQCIRRGQFSAIIYFNYYSIHKKIKLIFKVVSQRYTTDINII